MDRYDRYALVIGIAEYDSPSLPQLSKTKTDAESVAEVLEQYGSYRVDLLTEGVTAEKLDQALYTLLLEKAVGKEALIYFTGHGIKGVTGASYREKPQGFLAASDCKVEQCHNQSIIRGGSVALNSLNSMIEESKLSSLVVFLDSCHSGELLERELLDNSLTTFISRTDYCLITACRGSGKAYAKKKRRA
jgi:predicted peroxiredoxin